MKLYFLLVVLFLSGHGFAQNLPTNQVKHKMAIFTPLFLDQAFDSEGNYLYSNKSFPKNSITGLEFYHGASMAMDSLNKLNVPLEVYVYDSKSANESLEQQFSKCAADGVELIIANCSMTELALLARLGADKKITVINATVPNDANVTNNPYFIVLNPTIQTQIEGLYQFIKRQYPGKEITILTKNASSEKFIRNVFETLSKYYKNDIAFKYLEVNDDIALKSLGVAMQPSQKMVYVVGSLDTEFGSNVLKQFSANRKNYDSLTVIGMPTWENLNLFKTDYKGVEIVYSTPFYNSRQDATSKSIQSYYSKKMFARPSDLVFRAYGLTYKFGNMVSQFGKDINNHLTDKTYKTFFDFDIKPVYQNGVISHYENKKVYFLKYFNESLRVVN